MKKSKFLYALLSLTLVFSLVAPSAVMAAGPRTSKGSDILASIISEIGKINGSDNTADTSDDAVVVTGEVVEGTPVITGEYDASSDVITYDAVVYSSDTGTTENIESGVKVTGGTYTDTTAQAGESYEYTITGSDGSNYSVTILADDVGGTETITTTPEITWQRTADTYTAGTTIYRCSECDYERAYRWNRCPSCKEWGTCTKVTTEGSYNYVPDIAYVNSDDSYTSGGVTYDQYTALTWNWSALDKLINDQETKVNDVWSKQADGMSACEFSANASKKWDYANVYKISGIFAWPEGYDLNETTITIQSANDSSYSEIYNYINNNGLSDLFPNGKVLPVNDDVYVVMWVEDGKTTVTSSNINKYLLFWTGTSGKGFWTQNSNTNADWNRQTPATFISAGKQGVRAFNHAWPNAVGVTAGLKNTDVDNNTFSYLMHTDGWYTLTDTSAINSVMRNNYDSITAGATVHLDLYCFNNSGDGMIDELVVNLAKEQETETTVTVNYYYGNVTTPDDTEHFLGNSVLTNQAYGTPISLPAGTNASQLDYMRAAAIIKAGKQDVSNGTQVNNPLVVTRGADNVINVLYTAKDAKIVYLTAPSDTISYDGASHTLNTVTVTESGYSGSATAHDNGKYTLPDGNTLENVYSVVTATYPGKYPNNFTTVEGSTPSYIVRDSSNNDVTGTYTFVKTPGTLTITYDPTAVTYTYDFGVTNKYANTLNDVEQKATTVTESSNEVEVSDADVTYTPAAADTGDSVDLTLTFAGNYQVTKNITFVPATNVLYEENLVTTTGSDWTLTGETAPALPVVTDNGRTVYGYTDIKAYAESEGFSNGSAYKAELTLTAGATTTKTDTAATFTFTGTGFDLISECGTDTGMLLVKVSDSNGKAVRAYLVDTYFTGDSGENPIISGTGILDYQVPVIRNTNLDYGTYTVTVYGYLVNTAGAASVASYSLYDYEPVSSGITAEDIVIAVLDDLDFWDEIDVDDVEISFMSEDSVLNGGYGNTAAAGSGEASVMSASNYSSRTLNDSASGSDVTANVYIDGFRVYKPLENDAEIYTTDGENDVKYANVYDFIKNSVIDLDDWITNAFVYVEYDGKTETASIADYKIQGPQNEVYLTPGSGIAFALKGYKKGDVVQLAMKSVGKIDATADEAIDMPGTTATEMYYNVSVDKDDALGVNYVVITNNEASTGILALSGLKLSSHITAMGSEALGAKVIEQLNKTAEAKFVPKVLTASAPSSVKSGRNATISVQSSVDDVKAVKLFIDNAEEGIKLTPTNTKAVAAGKSDVYKYSYVVKTATLQLSADAHTFTVYAYDEDGQKSAPVTIEITVTQ